MVRVLLSERCGVRARRPVGEELMSVDDTTTTCEQLPVDGRRARRDRGRDGGDRGDDRPRARRSRAADCRAGGGPGRGLGGVVVPVLRDARRAPAGDHPALPGAVRPPHRARRDRGRACGTLASTATSRRGCASTRRPSRWPGSPAVGPSRCPTIDDSLHQARATAAEQIRRHFGAELALLTPARRDDLVALIATTTSFESWLQLRDDYARNTSQTRRAWTSALERLLTAP